MGHEIAILATSVTLVLGLAGCTETTGDGVGSSEHRENLVNGLITVKAGAYNYYYATVNPGFTNVRLTGSFGASGGSGDDIRVAVMDQMAFQNWKDGDTVSTYYSSGQVHSANFDVPIPGAGTYVLVYDNTFSAVSDKDVNTKADFLWVG